MTALRTLLVALALLFLGFTGILPASAQVDPILLGRAVDATVQLSIVVNGTIDGKAQIVWYAVGSGTFVSPEGLILTNQHLITPAGIGEKMAELEAQLAAEGKEAELEVDPERLMVAVSDGRHLPVPRYVAWVAASDPDLDLAVLRIDGDERGAPLDPAAMLFPALPLGSSDALNLGDPIHVFGFPAIGSGSLTYTAGLVSGFLFEEEIDGTAWINTDAVTSGGNSGGAAVNDAGELIGVPTSGSSLDCRAGDTNRDGTIGPEDVGCVPTGGSLTQVRPIDLAKPLLASVDATLTGEVGASAAISLPTASDTLAEEIAAAEGCAARGDWRCAANFYVNALANSPEDGAILNALYESYLALGRQEAAAGRLGSARSAFSGALATDPGRAEAQVALERLAPYSGAITIDGFDGDRHYVESEDPASRSAYSDSAYNLDITQPGLVSGYVLTQEPLAGQNYSVLLTIGAAEGDGMVTIETRTDPAGGQWVFAIDPDNRTWEVLRFDDGNKQFMPWAGPYSYKLPETASLETVELRVSGEASKLLINNVDVSAQANASLPAIGSEGEIRFGALMASEGVAPFHVTFDEVALYELA